MFLAAAIVANDSINRVNVNNFFIRSVKFSWPALVALHHHLLRRDDVGMGKDSWNAGRLQRNDGGMSVTERFG
jgi:hypothetical protein